MSIPNMINALVQDDKIGAESAFKALAVALRMAVSKDTGAGIPSTKGMLS